MRQRGFEYTLVNHLCRAVFTIPESNSSNLVKFKIYKASGNSVFLEGNAAYIVGINWKVEFIPTEKETYVVEIENITLDVKYTKIFKSVGIISMAYGKS